MSEIKKVKLLDGREIELKPLKTGDMRKALKEKEDIMQTCTMISYATGIPLSEIDNLDCRDYLTLQDAVIEYIKKTYGLISANIIDDIVGLSYLTHTSITDIEQMDYEAFIEYLDAALILNEKLNK